MALYFPVPAWDGTSFQEGQARFGWRREGGARTHAGCDIYAPLESEVKSISNGTVYELSSNYYRGSMAISINHPGIGIVRYGEILDIPEELFREGANIAEGGIVIGKVAKIVKVSAMLHFELFDGSRTGRLSTNDGEYYNEGVQTDGNYQRRSDLMNPTALLLRLQLEGTR